MFTRQDYMSKKCTHREYYAQFVTPSVKSLVVQIIGKEALSKSRDREAFNDIPLHRWDRIAEANKSLLAIDAKYQEWPGDSRRLWTLGGAVCILKEAARQITESNATH